MFSRQVGHCVYWVYIIILIIIIVVYYYYLSSLLAEDWHFTICLSFDAAAEKNKLLLLILFHKSLDSEIFLRPISHPSPYSSFSLSICNVDFGFYSIFGCQGSLA